MNKLSQHRSRIAQLLEANKHDYWGHWIDLGLMALILLNVVAVVLESVTALEARFHAFFLSFEIFSVVVFSVEYVLRVWSSIDRPDCTDQHPIRGRLQFMLTPYAVIDLIAILPFYLGFFIPHDLRFLRVIRLFRLFKLTRYSIAMQALLEALRAEADSLGAAFFLLFVLFILASSGIYLLENRIQPEAFGSIPAAMWWAMTTLTTVGYGDVVPITTWGKIFGGCITIIGVGMVALPAGIIASGFSEHLRQRRTNYSEILAILVDEKTSERERTLAAQTLCNALDLDEEHASRLMQAVTDGRSTTERKT